MHIFTANKALEDILETGKTSDRSYRSLPVNVIKGFKKAVSIMQRVKKIEELYLYKGLNYEKLKGDRVGQESVRCNDKYRLIFISSVAEDKIEITEIELLEITNHYV